MDGLPCDQGVRDGESASMMRRGPRASRGFSSCAVFPAPAIRAALPEDFVYLRDIDPTILQDIRYAGSNNFTGEPVAGYEAAECVLVRPAAEALAVQADLEPKA